jgi:hypothetical protein
MAKVQCVVCDRMFDSIDNFGDYRTCDECIANEDREIEEME